MLCLGTRVPPKRAVVPASPVLVYIFIIGMWFWTNLRITQLMDRLKNHLINSVKLMKIVSWVVTNFQVARVWKGLRL